MDLPLPRGPFPSFRLASSDTVLTVRVIDLPPDYVIGLVRHLRKNTGD